MHFQQWLLLLVFLIFPFLSPLISASAVYTSECNAYHCFENGNYSSESLYRTNLNTLLRSLSVNIDDAGFYNASISQVSAYALCRGDIQPEECRSCVRIIAEEILEQCPKRIQAIRWSEFCMVRYSNESIFGILSEVPVKQLRSVPNITNPERFKEVRAKLVDDLRVQVAASDGSRRKVAAGSVVVGQDNQTVYAMAQCTPDLSTENCTRCLAQAAGEIPGCCENAMGARVYFPSCILRYESVPFYNMTRLREPLVDSQQKGNEKKDDTARNVIIIVISIVISMILLAFCVAMIVRKRASAKQITPKGNDPEVGGDHSEIGSAESIQYHIEKIRVATNDFSDDNKLGQGGFGAVYRGKLVNGVEIAVKRLSKNSGQGDVEFKNEVLLVAKLQHRNLVRLLGFSYQGNEKLLIYEFVRNGSLDQFIFDRTRRSNLDWDKRYEIIRGITKGLLYLHEDSRLRIIHRDLKASNILLDEEMNPKISDFGMARMIVRDVSLHNTGRIVGTYGYMAPEYAKHGEFSVKSDTFSFGVLVLEIITGKKRIFHCNEENATEHLLNYAWKYWSKGMAANIIDPAMVVTSSDARQNILRCIHIALLCQEENASNRPTMARVLQLLNASSLPLPMPSPHGFSSPVRSLESSSSCSSSITKLYPR